MSQLLCISLKEPTFVRLLLAVAFVDNINMSAASSQPEEDAALSDDPQQRRERITAALSQLSRRNQVITANFWQSLSKIAINTLHHFSKQLHKECNQ